MKNSIFKLFCFFLCIVSVESEAISFKKSVNRLTAPVMIGDVISFGEKQVHEIVQWPEELRGWVSQSQVSDWAVENDIGWSTKNWTGPAKVWIEWCFVADENTLSALIRTEVVSLLNEKKLQLKSLNNLSVKDLPCASDAIVKHKILEAKIVTSNVIEVDVEITLKGNRKEVKTLPVKYSAIINALRLKNSSPKFLALSINQFIPEHVVWTGRELSADKSLENMRLVKSLKEKTILKESHIERVPDIPVGQKVKVVVVNGAVNVATKGHAVTSGNIGEKIKVRVTGTNIASDALVVAKGVVNVSV